MNDPVSALLTWLDSVDLPETIVLGCDHARLPSVPESQVGIRLDRCLGDLGISLLAQLVASGVASIEVVPCPDHLDQVNAQIDTWAQAFPGRIRRFQLGARHHHRRRSTGMIYDLNRPAVSRRSLLGLRPRRAAPFARRGDDADRALAALAALIADDQIDLADIPASDQDRVGVALVAKGCTMCGVCVRACNHSALIIDTVGETAVLRHRLAACRGDQSCVALCPVSALAMTGETSLVELVGRSVEDLERVAVVRCRRCGSRYRASGDDLCPTCRAKRDQPFSSWRANTAGSALSGTHPR